MTEYCCYCGNEKGEAISCCGENHFVPFSDLYEDLQKEILEANSDD
jgi:hypothetical protein